MKCFRRLSALLLCLFLLPGSFSSRAEEAEVSGTLTAEEYAEMEEQFQREYRFGQDAVVETGEDGEPVSVNGFPVRSVRAGFSSLGQEAFFQMTVDFMEYPFWRPATRYDGNLAVMSLMMAGSAVRATGFQDIPEADFDPSLHLEHFLTDAGFSDIRKDDYSKVPTMFTVSTAMGCRKMIHEGEEPFTLIAVGVCGGGYKNEWESNMTVGTGEIHEGFQNAAQLVIDRLAGYIATRGIEGRVKVWISGYSRAAAVSNVVAGTLVNTGYLPKEDVYAYTFATPSAVRSASREGYENIFNIIDPADVVPQVVPMEWGYGRYGTDLYLGVQEYSSYLGFLDNEVRSEANRDSYNVEYKYSPALTLRTRLLFSLLLDLTENPEGYNERFQPALVSLLHNRTVNNTLSILRDLMLNIRLVNRADKARLDEMVDFFLQVFSGIAMRSGYEEADRNTGDMFMRFVVEHTMNSYVSALYNIRNAEFLENERCCYLMVRGPVSLSMREADTGLEVIRVDSDGRASVPDGYMEPEWMSKMFYTERSGSTTVLCVPMDYDYQVVWTAEKDGTVECVQAMAGVRAAGSYPGMRSEKVRVRAGDTGTAFQSRNLESVPLEGFQETSLDARTLAEFLGIASLGFNWRLALTVLFALLALIVCVSLCLIAAFKPSRRKRYSFLIWAVLCVLGVAASETEAAYWFFADQAWVRLAWKGTAAICYVLLFFLLPRRKESLMHTFFPSILLAVTADVVISLHFVAGAALFLMCHALLSWQFLHFSPMRRGRWIQWAVVSMMLDALIILFYVPRQGAAGWAVAVYAPVLLLMAFSSGRQPLRIRASAMLFLISDLLLGLYGTLLEDPIIHAVYMFLFYTALLMLTLGPSRSAETAGAAEDGALPAME